MKRRKRSGDSCTPNSQTELNLLHSKLENFHEKLSSPVHTNPNKHRASTLPTAIYECYELPVESYRKPVFQSVHLHIFIPNKRKPSRGNSLSKDSFENDPDYYEIREELIRNLPSTRVLHFFVLATPQYSLPQRRKEVHQSLQMLTPLRMISLCWKSMRSCPRHSHRWCFPTHCQSLNAKCKHRRSFRWPNLHHIHILWKRQTMHE